MPNGDGTGPLGKGCGRRKQSFKNQSMFAETQTTGNRNLRRGLRFGMGSGNGAGDGSCAQRRQRLCNGTRTID